MEPKARRPTRKTRAGDCRAMRSLPKLTHVPRASSPAAGVRSRIPHCRRRVTMNRYDRTSLRGRSNAPPGYRPEVVDPSFRIVQDLAAELSTGKISFPTFIDATLKIRRALNDPNADADRIARTISAEPLLAAKLVQVA